MNKLTVVGIGPGEYEQMTVRAVKALEESEAIIGYTVYVELIRDHFPDKLYLTTPMTKEVDRCHMALQKAQEGVTTAIVCSGDAGVYGMAGLIYELSEMYPLVQIDIIAGVTAAMSGAAILGAPLNHDFAVISLSDLLTPWELIEKRLLLAAQADLAIAIYNPSSKKRVDYLRKACELILTYQQPETICGYTKNIGREGEEAVILSLIELKETALDMFTTVFIGNSRTKIIGGKMITPRGYKNV